MPPSGPTKFRRCVRIATVGLVMFGALALGHKHARAQLGIDTLRQVVDKAKAGKAVPKDALKGKIMLDACNAVPRSARPGACRPW